MKTLFTRRSMFPAMLAAMPFVQKGKPIPPPQPSAVFHGVINAGDYQTLQAAATAAFGPVESPNGTAYVSANKTLYIPNGVYLPPFSGAPVLDLRYLHGGRIIGSGRFVTKLVQNVAGVPVIRTNGCGYSHFEGMLLEHQVGVPGVGLDLNWDGSAGGAALQSNTFADMFFHGGSIGVNIGASGFMGSENLFQNCFWLSNSVAGLLTSNFNALQQSIIGGNFQGCGVGVWVGTGSVNLIHGAGFQLSADCDIKTSGSANNGMSVVGCRTESVNFIHNDASHAVKVDACTQWGAVVGNFIRSEGGMVVLSSPVSQRGRVEPKGWCQMTIENGNFFSDALISASLRTFATYQGAMDIRNTFYVDANGVDRLIRSQHWTSPDNGLTVVKRDAVYT